MTPSPVFWSDLPLWEGALDFAFQDPVQLQAMPCVTLRGLTGYALAARPGAAGLFKPEDGPQPFTYHVPPGRMLYLRDTANAPDADVCETLRATVAGFTPRPGDFDSLARALANHGADGWGDPKHRTPYALRWRTMPPRQAPWSRTGDTGRAAWRVVLESPVQLRAQVCGGSPDGPRQRLRLEEILDAAHPIPVFFHGQEAGIHMILHTVVMAAARRVRELAHAAGAQFQLDHEALSDLVWADSEITRLAIEPRRNLWELEDRGKRDFSGLIGMFEVEGPAPLGRLLESAALTGIGEKVNYGCGRLHCQQIA